jgi:hypothetical protein
MALVVLREMRGAWTIAKTFNRIPVRGRLPKPSIASQCSV